MTEAFILLEKSQKIQELFRLRMDIDTIEKATKISVRDYLGFGNVDKPLKVVKLSYGVYVGELNADVNPHGRGISINFDGTLMMQYFDDGECAPGNMISTRKGAIVVGAFKKKDGEDCLRCTLYDESGTILKKIE